MKLTYTPKGVCSRQMTVEAENGRITDVQVVGGCNGNLKGIASLLKGMEVDQAIARLEGIRCGGKPTSCPDQIACALKQLREL
ncbi:MAG: TIGR03905 family TSCPD domain-containing protein [Oscillospiraceae bacterium]|nr:TIGR03905 family TSCPD domain-containing protein [Oscillospiraceae bacterium]MCD8376307.1 TIGR03905 family TSCPD domain-containing protein [Oscillospiraceae bacterium]